MKPDDYKDINAYKKQYIQLPFESTQSKLRREEVCIVLNEFKPRRVLEIGCGLEPLFLQYRDFDSMTVVEPAKEFARNAWQLKDKSNFSSKITIINDFFESVIFKENNFDMILVVGLLHEVSYLDNFLEKLWEVAPVGCNIIINVPNKNSFHRQLAVNLGLIKDVSQNSQQQNALQQRRIFDKEYLQECLQGYSYKVIKSEGIIFKPFTHNQMQKIIDYNILSQQAVEKFCKMTDLLDKDCASELLLVLEKCNE